MIWLKQSWEYIAAIFAAKLCMNNKRSDYTIVETSRSILSSGRGIPDEILVYLIHPVNPETFIQGVREMVEDSLTVIESEYLSILQEHAIVRTTHPERAVLYQIIARAIGYVWWYEKVLPSGYHNIDKAAMTVALGIKAWLSTCDDGKDFYLRKGLALNHARRHI
jgi:hypothetical protein